MPRTRVDELAATAVYPGGLWVDPGSAAADEVARLRAEGRPRDAALIQQIATQPVATWLTESITGTTLSSQLVRQLDDVEAVGATPVFVTYAIPDRDCGDHSAGGFADAASYLAWNRTIVDRLSGRTAVVLIEPDAIAMLGDARCPSVRASRLPLIADAVTMFAEAGIPVYLDGGNSHWMPADVMAERLQVAGVGDARGFFTNVSNFYRVDQERGYASELARMISDKHFVIDVSRNGAGWRGTWCNPRGAALGENPRVVVGTDGVAGVDGLDALLWVKPPGQSDGPCNGGPAAGEWFASYARALVRNRRRV